MGRTVFVTGGTGFVGSHLVEELLNREADDVRCLVRSRPKWLDGLPVHHVQGGLHDLDALLDGVSEADEVYHVAGLTRAPSQEQLDKANVAGTLNVLEAVRQAAPHVQRVVIVSSLAAVGPSPVEAGVVQPLDEAAPLAPISMYGRSKATMEWAVENWRAKHPSAPPISVVRPPAVYGPREADIFTVIQTASRGLFPIVGDGEAPALSLVHVRDLVRGIADLAESPLAKGETYFVGSEAAYSWSEIRDAVVGALGRRALTLKVPSKLVAGVGTVVEKVAGVFGQYPPLNREKAEEARHAWICSVDKAKRHVGYGQQVALDEGMRETVAWYRAEGWL
ncbi:MAG: NAD-dependent epimerase/dehydratase family protein [Bacteroidota bacterium]